MPEPIRLTRKELYDRVWSTPLWKLGPELGRSDRGLGKLCVREGIPAPNRGYWARKQHGYNPPQPKLPPRQEGQREVIEFYPWRTKELNEAEDAEPALDPVPVLDVLTEPHPLVVSTLKASRTAKKQADGRILLPPGRHLGLEVSREALDHALRVADALVKALEAKGCTIRPAAEKKQAAVEIGPDSVPFRLVEQLNKTIHPLNARELKDKELRPYMYSRPIYDYSPTGLLTLHLDDAWVPNDTTRRTWGGGKKLLLEKLLPRAVEAILHHLSALKAFREEKELEAQRRAERERQRLLDAMEEFQDDRRAAIVERRLGWARLAREIGEWSAVLQEADQKDMTPELWKRWSTWIEGYVKRLESSSRRLPAFEGEPTYEDRKKYKLDSW